MARRMSLITASAGGFPVPDFCLIFAPSTGYDEQEILNSALNPFCLVGAAPGAYASELAETEPIEDARVVIVGRSAPIGADFI